MTAALLTINLDALARNYAFLRDTAGVEAAPAVKADGYGLGADRVALRLRNEGAKTFYVARLIEGEALRATLGPAPTIQVLDGAAPGSAERLITADLTPVLNSLEQASRWRAEGGGRPATLHVDTGMNRLGVTPTEAETLAGWGAVSLVISHLACSGQPDHPLNARQLAVFRQAAALFPQARASLAASGGILLGPDFAFDQVRPGVSLFGGGPREAPDDRIAAVATLEAPILQVRDVPAGESVGYGAAYIAGRDTRVAILAAGYADGVLRSSHPRGAVWFDGARRPILGRISMDLMAIDVSGCTAAREGALVEILGPNLLVDDAAAAAGTTAYELLTRLSPRAERRYLGG
jgi:alanine racemase